MGGILFPTPLYFSFPKTGISKKKKKRKLGFQVCVTMQGSNFTSVLNKNVQGKSQLMKLKILDYYFEFSLL